MSCKIFISIILYCLSVVFSLADNWIFNISGSYDRKYKFLQDSDENVYLCEISTNNKKGKIIKITETEQRVVLEDNIDDFAVRPDGAFFLISDGKIFKFNPTNGMKIDLTSKFSPYSYPHRMEIGKDGTLFIESCPVILRIDDTFTDAPFLKVNTEKKYPVPSAFDQYGNAWGMYCKDGKLVPIILTPDDNMWKFLSEDDLKCFPEYSKKIVVDENGKIVAIGDNVLGVFDPRKIEKGWRKIYIEDKIKVADLGPDGNVVLFSKGNFLSLHTDVEEYFLTTNKFYDIKNNDPYEIFTDSLGQFYVVTHKYLFKFGSSPDMWQNKWKPVGRLPCGNHDISAVVFSNTVYIAGGYTAGFGYPARPSGLRDILAYDNKYKVWRRVGKLSIARWYSGMAELNGLIWIINGFTDVNGKKVPTDSVEIFNPLTGDVIFGPRTSVARGITFAANLGGRIYVINGTELGKGGDVIFESIGWGEEKWRMEGNVNFKLGPIAGTADNRKMYLVAHKLGIIEFDSHTLWWTNCIISPPVLPRSPQVVIYDGGLWLIGGRDIPTEREVFIYRFEAGRWETGPLAPRPVGWGAASVIENKLMITGGAIGTVYSDRSFILRDS